MVRGKSKGVYISLTAEHREDGGAPREAEGVHHGGLHQKDMDQKLVQPGCWGLVGLADMLLKLGGGGG